MVSWPLVEPLVIAWLNARLAPTRASTDVPGNVETLINGFIRVTRAPGNSQAGRADDGVTDFPGVDLEAFHPNRLDAARLAERCREEMHALAASDDAGALVDDVETSAAPAWVFYGPNVDRYVATYALALRRAH